MSRLGVLEGPSRRRVRSEAERARVVAESLLPGAQVSEMARKHGATRWQIYDWRRRFRQQGMLPLCEASQPIFAPLVVEGALEGRQVPARQRCSALILLIARLREALDRLPGGWRDYRFDEQTPQQRYCLQPLLSDSSGGGTATANKSGCVRSGIFIGISSFGGGIPHRRGYEMVEHGTNLEEGLKRSSVNKALSD
ncbi:transposase [Bradyrhizobium sp. CAR08]